MSTEKNRSESLGLVLILLLDTHCGNGRVVPADYLGRVPLDAAH